MIPSRDENGDMIGRGAKPFVEAPWCKMPMSLMMDQTYSRFDLMLYAYLDYRSGKRGWWYEDMADIAATVKGSKSSIIRAIERLEEGGYIGVLRQPAGKKRANTYYIAARGVSLEHATSSPWGEDGFTGETHWVSPVTPTKGVTGDTTSNLTTDLNTTDLSKEAAAPSSAEKSDLERIFEHYKKVINAKARSDGRLKIRARLKTYSESELIQAMNNFSQNEWWMLHHKGDGADTFFRDDKQIERFLNLEPARKEGGSGERSNGPIGQHGANQPSRGGSGLSKYK